MKKNIENNFTKLTPKKGISLIVLIVTIIVIIILAAVVILTITKNNPVESAKKATFKEDIKTFQDDLALTVAKQYTDNKGQRDEKISTSDYEKIREYIPSFTEKYKGKFIIQDGQLIGIDSLSEKEKIWLSDVNVPSSGKALFDYKEWDKTATPEDCFMWGSDTKGEDGYNVIVGYKSKLQNYSKVRIPSRCQRIICDGYTYSGEANGIYLDDIGMGRVFLNNIQKMELPETVIEVGGYAFGGLNGNSLKSVSELILPNSVTNIKVFAFSCCDSLLNIEIPDKVRIIEGYSFADCRALNNIILPIGITNIENYVFSGCTNLTNITYKGTKTQWNSIIKDENGWKYNSNIKTITCTDGVITL